MYAGCVLGNDLRTDRNRSDFG